MIYMEYNTTDRVGDVVRAVYPDYRRNFLVKLFKGPMTVNSYWDGGSKNEYTLVDLETLQVYRTPTSHPYFDGKGTVILKELPPNVALVTGGWFAGQRSLVVVHLLPDNMVPMIEPTHGLDEQQFAALETIRIMKGGKYRAREFERRGLGEYGKDNELVKQLLERGYVTINKAGAITITVKGKNVR